MERLGRQGGLRVVTRVMGVAPDIVPDHTTIKIPLDIGDAFVLCTDGFWEHIYEKERSNVLRSNMPVQDTLAYLEQVLLSRVQPGNDNYTATIIKVVN